MVPEEVGLWKRVEGRESRSWDELRSHIRVAKAETSLVIKGRRGVRVLIWRIKAGSGKTEDSFLGIGEGRLRVCPVAFAYVTAPKVTQVNRSTPRQRRTFARNVHQDSCHGYVSLEL